MLVDGEPRGELLHDGVRRGCAPVLASFGLKIFGLGYIFSGNLGLGLVT